VRAPEVGMAVMETKVAWKRIDDQLCFLLRFLLRLIPPCFYLF
jgi:hypothetical protein